MNLSNIITQMLIEMMGEEGLAEIQRNELAERLGCVPSQINYVLSSRFTPEHGYIVESKRGGGGSIKIRRISFDRPQMIMHAVNSIGSSIDDPTCKAFILNLQTQNFLSNEAAMLILAATNENNFRFLQADLRNIARANILKQMMIAAN